MKYALFTLAILFSACKTNEIASDVNYTTDTNLENRIINTKSNNLNDNGVYKYQQFKNSINRK